MAIWPVTLPQRLLASDFEEIPPDLTIRTQMDSGAPKVRRRWSAAPRLFSCRLLLTGAQTETLDAFYYTTLVGGFDAFDWLHPRTLAAGSFKLVGPPRYSAAGAGMFFVTLQLELQL